MGLLQTNLQTIGLPADAWPWDDIIGCLPMKQTADASFFIHEAVDIQPMMIMSKMTGLSVRAKIIYLHSVRLSDRFVQTLLQQWYLRPLTVRKANLHLPGIDRTFSLNLRCIIYESAITIFVSASWHP